jgi:hypothetical protein
MTALHDDGTDEDDEEQHGTASLAPIWKTARPLWGQRGEGFSASLVRASLRVK